jgi:citrate lyase subunit beta / citryl-CoA lyase
VPASSPRKLEKAYTLAADELVLDLEDAVAVGAKDEARAGLAAALGTAAPDAVAVRVNAPRTPWCHRDIAVVSGLERVTSIVVPKVESAGDLAFVERLLDGTEPPGRGRRIGIQALVETAAGLARVSEIAAASPRLEALILGYADLSASLGRGRALRDEPAAWIVAQEAVLVAARANALEAIDGPYLGVEPDEAFAAAVRHARDLGFDGKWAIHPSQLELLNDLFTPDAAETAHARSVVEAMAGAEGEGVGALLLDGQMLDQALLEQALRVLARAGVEVGRG